MTIKSSIFLFYFVPSFLIVTAAATVYFFTTPPSPQTLQNLHSIIFILAAILCVPAIVFGISISCIIDGVKNKTLSPPNQRNYVAYAKSLDDLIILSSLARFTVSAGVIAVLTNIASFSMESPAASLFTILLFILFLLSFCDLTRSYLSTFAWLEDPHKNKIKKPNF